MIRSSKHVISALIVMCLQLHPESSVSSPPGLGGSVGVPGLVVESAPEVAVGRVPVSPSRVHCGKKGFVQDVIYTIYMFSCTVSAKSEMLLYLVHM